MGRAWKYYASADAVDLTAVTGKPARCARRIVALAAGTWSVLQDNNGNNEAPGAVFQGFTHDADTKVITSNVAILVYW